jgi:hypothetical protein
MKPLCITGHQTVVAAVLVVTTSSCAARQTQPVIASSADASTYALRYPGDLEVSAKALSDDKAEAQTLSSDLSQRSATLEGAKDADLLLAIVQRADEAGRGQAFVSAREEARIVRSFYEEERGPITSRVNGATQKELAAKQCQSADVSGPVARSTAS